MKKTIFLIMTILSVFGACLLTVYASNEVNIKNFNKGEYSKNMFAFLGFTQPYVEHYNNANMYYKQGMYDLAIEEYDKALAKNPPHSHYNDKKKANECKIRINKVLAMMAEINVDEIEKEDVASTLELINEAKAVLKEKGCATDSYKGHCDDANTLYKELCELEEAIKNKQDGSAETKDGDGDSKKPEPEQNEPPEDESKKQQLIDMQKDSLKDRNKEIQETRNFYEDSYSDAHKKW